MIELTRSELEMFINCRRSFYLQYVLGLKRSYPVGRVRNFSKADIGTLVHYWLAEWYRGKLTFEQATNPVYTRGLMIEHLLAEMNTGFTVADEISEEWQRGCVDYAVAMANSTVAWTQESGADEYYEVLHVEERIGWETTALGQAVLLTGEPDLIVYDALTEEQVILDHKSVANMNRQIPGSGNFQGKTYGVIYYKATGHLAAQFIHNQIKRIKMAARSKGPLNARTPVELTEDQLELHSKVLKRTLENIVQFIEDTQDPMAHWLEALPNYSGECDWKCRAQELCECMDDGMRWQDVAAKHYDATPVVLTSKETK